MNTNLFFCSQTLTDRQGSLAVLCCTEYCVHYIPLPAMDCRLLADGALLWCGSVVLVAGARAIMARLAANARVVVSSS